ncbi:unnamed protein product [Lota lota]
MGDVDPEDAKSLDSSDGVGLLAGEENHSSPSDMVHLEREDAEMLEDEEEAVETEEEEETEEVETAGAEEEDEMQSSVLSMLGGEQELEELRREEEEEEEQHLRPLSSQLLVAAAEDVLRAGAHRHLSGRVAPTATPPMPIFKLQPPSSTSTPVPSITSSSSSCRPSEVVEEQRYSRQELLPPPVLVPVVAGQPVAATESHAPDQSRFSQIPLGSVGEEKVPVAGPRKPTMEAPDVKPDAAAKPAGSTDLPMMLCGGAVLVAVVGVVAYGTLAYGRK